MHTYTLIQEGALPEAGQRVMVMIHGRGADANSILSLKEHLELDSFTLIAPQATTNTWYPYSFLSPREKNQPWLDSALGVLKRISDELLASGVNPTDIYWLGFSQGACLALEFVATQGEVYGGVVGLSGGVIGDTVDSDRYKLKLSDMPVILGCSDVDSHIPVERVHETEAVFSKLGASVSKTIYPGMGHIINEDEIRQINELITK